MKKLAYLLLISCLLALAPRPASPAAGGASPEAEYMTKGQAVMMLSTTEFMKRKIGELLSWTVGYDVTKVSQVRMTPVIHYIKAIPKKVPPDGRTILEVTASVDDPEGLKNIKGVRADLSSIGRLSNMVLVDNGFFGDEKAGDGIFTLQTNVNPKVDLGEKEVAVAAANKKGWVAVGKTTIMVKKDPEIISKEVRLKDGTALFTIKVDNPGRIDDIRQIELDLSSIGMAQPVAMRNDGRLGDEKSKDDIYSVIVKVPLLMRGTYPVPVTVTNLSQGVARGEIDLIIK